MKTHFEAHITSAKSYLDAGDPETAVEFLKTAVSLAPNLGLAPTSDLRKLVEQAREEAEIGSPERAEHLLDSIKDQLTTKAEFVAYLRRTLIPDLKESGYFATAEDFERCCQFMSESN